MEEAKDNDINSLAEKAYGTTILNKYLEQKLLLYKKYIYQTKNAMQKCLLEKKNSVIKIFDLYIKETQKDYDSLKEEYNKKYNPKYQSLLDECLSDITMGKPVLKQYRAEMFALDYLKSEKEDLINGLKKSLKQSKQHHLFREIKRDSLIDLKQGNKEIEKIKTELQQNMLYECKQCNKFIYRISKYNYQIEEIKKNIDILKKYINEETSKNHNDIKKEDNIKPNPEKKEETNEIYKLNPFFYGKKNFKQSVNMAFIPNFNYNDKNEKDPNNSDENRGHGSGEKIKRKKTGGINIKKSLNRIKNNKKKKNAIIKEFKKVEDLFDISSEEGEKENLIDDELHSDDETVFEKRIIQPKKIKEFYLEKVKKTIPEINLKQIEFNKLKIMKEADLYSFQRRNFKSQNIDNNIKELKKKIEKMKEKYELMQQKENIMREYISKVKNKYQSIKQIVQRTSVANQKIEYIKESLIGPETINEENNEEDMGEGEVASDYDNEEFEVPDQELKNQLKGDWKKSAFVGRYPDKNTIKNKKFQKSTANGIFKNKLRDKLKKGKRAKSK